MKKGLLHTLITVIRVIENIFISQDNTLYVSLSFTYDFASLKKRPRKKFIKEIENKLNSQNKVFTGNKIILMAAGVMLGTIILTKPLAKTTSFNMQYLPSTKLVAPDSEDVVPKVEIIKESVIEQIAPSPPTITEPKQATTSEPNQAITSEQKVVAPPVQVTPQVVPEVTPDVIPSKAADITLYRSNGQILSLTWQEYLVGVVAAEMPASFALEALKAQAIVARTYTQKKMQAGVKITDKISFQVYNDDEQLHTLWGAQYQQYHDKVLKAVQETNKQVIKYNNELIDAVYHSTSNGYTENAVNVWGNYVPYLVSVDSSIDRQASSFFRETTFTYTTLSTKLGFIVTPQDQILINRDDHQLVTNINWQGHNYTGVEFRTIVGLRSTDFTITLLPEQVMIATNGYGHGVGMSQYGANFLAQQGRSASEIITHYYSGARVVDSQ